MQIRQMLSSVSFGLSDSGGGTKPSLFSFRDLDIRMPPQMLNFADGGKGSKAMYGNPALARQPQPNVIILTNNRKDTVSINGSHINAPHRTLVIVAHGGLNGVQNPRGGDYRAKDLAAEIKQKLGAKFSQYDQIVLVSCRIALAGTSKNKPDGSYAQAVADALGKPVYAATEFSIISAQGQISIAGSTVPTHGARKKDINDPGRFIRFDPGGEPSNSSALQTALAENQRANEDDPGAGVKVDNEFSGPLKAGRCMNATVAQCIRK